MDHFFATLKKDSRRRARAAFHEGREMHQSGRPPYLNVQETKTISDMIISDSGQWNL